MRKKVQQFYETYKILLLLILAIGFCWLWLPFIEAARLTDPPLLGQLIAVLVYGVLSGLCITIFWQCVRGLRTNTPAPDKITYCTAGYQLAFTDNYEVISMKAEKQMEELDQKLANKARDSVDIELVLQYAKYLLKHLTEILLDLCNPLRRATFFGVIFNEIPRQI